MPPSLTLDLQDQEEKAVPSESDVLDILSSAHASHSQVGEEGGGGGYLWGTIIVYSVVS